MSSIFTKVGTKIDNAIDKTKTWAKKHKGTVIGGAILIAGGIAYGVKKALSYDPDKCDETEEQDEPTNFGRDMTLRGYYDDTGEQAPGEVKCTESFYNDMTDVT